MRLTIIGCSGSFPGPESPASSYLLEAEGFRLVLDLGNGALGVLQRHADLYDIDAVALSHLHADHCLDMCGYWVARRYAPGGPQPALPVHAPDGAAQRLTLAYGPEAAAGRSSGPGMAEAFTFHPLTPGTRSIGPFQVTTARMNHPVETYGFRFEHGGRALAYSADTGPSEALIDLARDADLLLCEASFLDGPDLPPNLHLTGRQAGQHAARAGARHLVLTHIAPGTDKQRSFAEAREVFAGPLSLAASGQTFELAPSGPLPL
jgi:ribonuclease BN (tRNA processing enzyme)